MLLKIKGKWSWNFLLGPGTFKGTGGCNRHIIAFLLHLVYTDENKVYINNVYIYAGPDLGKKLDEAGISAAKRPGGTGDEAGGKFRWGGRFFTLFC